MKKYYILFILTISFNVYSQNEMNIMNTLPQNGIYKLTKVEINELLAHKEDYLNINVNIYDDKYTISLNDQLLLMIDNNLIDEDFVINFFDKISDKYKRKIINQIFHLGINHKYRKIINHLSKYLEVNNKNFDENYLLILNIQLNNNLSKNIELGYDKLFTNYENENYNKELLNYVIKYYDLEKSIVLLDKLINTTSYSLLAYSNNNAFYALFNRCFNTSKENIAIKIIYNYLKSRKIDNEWLALFDLLRYFDEIVDINELVISKTKENSSTNEYISILNSKKKLLSSLNATEKLNILRKIKRKINYSTVLINEHDYYKFQDFDLSLKIELRETILFGDGEFGSIHYSTLIYEYFKPISNSDLDNIIFIDRIIGDDYENREIIAIFDNSTAIATKPKFLADWVDINTFLDFMNFIVKVKGIKKKFLIKNDVFLYYENE